MPKKGHVDIDNGKATPSQQHPENKVVFKSDGNYEIYFTDSSVFGTGQAHLHPGDNEFEVKVDKGSTDYTVDQAAAVPSGSIIVP